MKTTRTLLIIGFLLISVNTFAQEEQPYIVPMTEKVCECTSKLDYDLDAQAFQTQYLGCFTNILVEFAPQFQDDYSMANEAEMTALGEKIGLEMLTVCPDTLIKLGYKLNDSESGNDDSAVVASGGKNIVEVGRPPAFEYIQIMNIYNDEFTTVVEIKFAHTVDIEGTLHAPDGQYPYVLGDKQGKPYALKYQEGWRGPSAYGFGSITIPANTERIISLHFEKVADIEQVFSLTEKGCTSDGGSCWNFYNIKVSAN
jgi:hypothetical protein